MNQEIISPCQVNIVTEHKERYKLINLFLMDSYNGITPSLLSKLAHVLFNLIIYNKLNKKPNNKDYSLEEDKRIYSNILITPENILERISPAKYKVENKNASNDISNLTAKIKKLEDNNIFYVWRYRQPYTYLFIMERDIGCWKYYNSSAYVTPKTLKKIVRAGKCIIDTMVKLEGKRRRSADLEDIEKSFGNFLNRMIDKMNPKVASELSRWVNTANIYRYLIRLTADLRPIDDFEGQVIAPDFLDHLPNPVKNEITKTKGKKMNSLELELIPQNGNLAKVRKTRKRKTTSTVTPITVATKFVTTDPFIGSSSFSAFYRSVIKTQNPDAKFYSKMAESSNAEQALDVLIKSGRSGNLKFLKDWIIHYFSVALRGNNIYKPEKTSLQEFIKTFAEFNGSYYG